MITFTISLTTIKIVVALTKMCIIWGIIAGIVFNVVVAKIVAKYIIETCCI